MSVPEGLLECLDVSFQSEEQLAARLGVGGAGVREGAAWLVEQGYPLLVSGGRYALAPGTPTPRALQPRGVFGRAYRYLGTVGSTQDELRAWEDAPHGAVVVAERQTAGRGRRGRVWVSSGLNLMFSVLLRPAGSLQDLTVVPLAAGVALREACGVGGLKWPNDLLAPDGRKLAGVLLEVDVRGEQVRRAVLGVGLNVLAAPEGAASLSEFRSVTRVDVLRRVLSALERWVEAPRAEVLAAWREWNVTLGREVNARTPAGNVQGIARSLGEDGALLVEVAGTLRRVDAGDVDLVARWDAGQSV